MKQRGFALILVLWALLLLSIIAASFSSTVRVETRSGSFAADATRLEATVTAAIHLAILAASASDTGYRWKPDGATRRLIFNALPVDIVLRNEGGKIDLNYAPRALLINLFSEQLPGVSANQLADALIDWRDRDNRASEFGAEATDYLAAGLKHVPGNAPLRSVAELTQVLGFDERQVDLLRLHVTVYARRPKVDVSSASKEVISALPGIGTDVARMFVENRNAAQRVGQRIDAAPLEAARRFIVLQPIASVINIDVLVYANGHKYREQAVVRLQSANGTFQILARELVAVPDSDTRS